MDRQSFAESETDERPEVGIVVVAYKAAAHLERLLLSLEEQGRSARWRCVVVDNSASDEVREVVARRRMSGSRLDVVVPDRNLGYAAACNMAVSCLRESQCIMIVNPDVVMTRPFSELVRQAQTVPTGLVAGGVTAVPSGRTLSNVRPRLSPRRELAYCLGIRREQHEIHRGGGPMSRVEELSGALLLFESEFYRSLGGMDELFELYYEDSDLSLQAAKHAGCWLDEREYARHEAGSTTGRGSAPDAYRVLRVSRVRALRKHWGIAGSSAAAVVAVIELLVRSVTARPEGARLRLKSFADQWREVRSPGSVWILHRSVREGS